MDNPSKVEDVGVALFQETPKWVIQNQAMSDSNLASARFFQRTA